MGHFFCEFILTQKWNVSVVIIINMIQLTNYTHVLPRNIKNVCPKNV